MGGYLNKPMNKLDEYRHQYREATTQEARDDITEAAKAYKASLYQCYYQLDGKQCQARQEEMWCSEKHRIAWQEENYRDKPKEKRRLTMREMREKINQMGIEARLRAHTEKDGQVKIGY